MIKLQTNKLYILSGLPGSGKTTFLERNNIPKDMILSLDKIREQIFGIKYSFDDDGIKENLVNDCDNVIGEIFRSMLRLRMENKLTTFIDGTNSNDDLRSFHIKIAQEYGVDSTVLIFDEKKAEKYNKLREKRVDEIFFNKFKEKFENKSKYDYIKVKFDDKVEFDITYTIPEDIELCVVGDIHGQFEKFEKLIEKEGFQIKKNCIVHKNKNKRVLFLGDVIDRGEDSLKMLEIVKNSVENGHYFISGNHEEKLLKNYESYSKNGKVDFFEKRSIAVCKMFFEFLELDEKKQEEYIQFIKKTPFYYVHKNFCFVHANIEYFDPLNIRKSEAIYGLKDKYDSDMVYQKLYETGINLYNLVRGHIPIQDENLPDVISLDNRGEYNGSLILYNCVSNEIIYQETKFDYHKKIAKKRTFQNKLKKLQGEGYIFMKESDNGFYRLYKYTDKTFFKNKWNKDKILLETRGIVIDSSYDIITYPFTKLFSFEEKKDEIYHEKELVAVEKINGFLFNVSKGHNKTLLFTTNGSFDSDFLELGKQFIDEKIKDKLINYFNENSNITLMFEVVHPNDPHIIKYNKKDEGLYLIGARKNVLHSKLFEEETLDLIAKDLSVKRPNYFTIVKNKIEDLKKQKKVEGYIIRDYKSGDSICKLKTDYYTTIKTLGRMKDNKLKKLFENHKPFLQQVPDDYRFVVEELAKNYDSSKFLSYDENKRVDEIRKICDKIKNNLS